MRYSIEKEDFEKLDQLDRIEYRQVERSINEKTEGTFIGSLLSSILIYLGISAFAILIAIIKPEYASRMLELVEIAVIIFVYPVLMFILEIFLIFFRAKKIKELNDKYFSANIKPKKK